MRGGLCNSGTTGVLRREAISRIAIFLPSLNGGGAERVALFLCPVLEAAGYTVDLVVARRFGALCDDPVARRFAVHLDAPNEMLSLPRLLAYIDRARPDLLFALVHSAKIMAGLAKLRRPELNLAISVHNTLNLPPWQRFWPRILGHGLERRLYTHVAAAHVVSDGLAAEVQRRFALPPPRITRIYNPVMPRGAEGAIAPEHVGWFDRPCLISAGRMVAQKNQRDLVQAFAQSGLGGRARLIIFGEGPLHGRLAAQAKSAGVAGDVILPGFVPDIMPYLRRSAGFLLSSRNEGFGLVLLEALIAGCPVATYDCPIGPAEVIDHGRLGRLLPRGDVAGLAAAMRDMVEGRQPPPDPASVARHCAQFDPAVVSAQYLAFFKRIVPG